MRLKTHEIPQQRRPWYRRAHDEIGSSKHGHRIQFCLATVRPRQCLARRLQGAFRPLDERDHV
jgi:hypothetical protein